MVCKKGRVDFLRIKRGVIIRSRVFWNIETNKPGEGRSLGTAGAYYCCSRD